MSKHKRILSGDDILTLAERSFSFDVEVYCKEVYSFAERLEQAVLQSEQVQALRKDAERYLWLRDGGNDDMGVVAGFDCIDVGSAGVVGIYRECLDGEQLDKAIDEAMGRQE